jgi:acetolactate synthase-1/2/3 large subunit
MATVGQRLIEGLADRGVEIVFGIPGVHTVELYRGLAAGRIRHVTARHEQGAAFMADGYARVSGKPGVALVITGPGVTNALTAMAQARADSVPMLVISGVNRRASLRQGLGLLHELPDQAALVAALCPTETLVDPAELGPALDRAFARMATGRPGPVHLQIPTDVMGQDCPALAPPMAPPGREMPDLAPALARMAAARAPVILAGGGARRAPSLARLARLWDAPVVQTTNARGSLFDDPLCVPASPSLDATRALIAQADCILAVGTELGPTDYDMYVRGGLPDLSGMIRIDICPDQLARHPAELTLQGDAEALCAALAAATIPRARSGGARRAAAARQAARAELAQLSADMPAQLAMVEALRDACPGSVIVGDSTQPVYAANLWYDHDRPGGWFNAATGYGALGFAPGAAVGAALAAAGNRVICLIGDGGLQFSPGELRSAVDEGLPILFVVWNNAGFREIAQAMAGAGTSVIGCSPSPLRMPEFAAACDLPFASVAQDPDALARAAQHLCASPGPAMIEIRVSA